MNAKEGLDRGKVALIYIYRILQNYSDYDHPLTQQDIIDYLETDYNVTMERKAIKRNLTVLEEAGIEIDYLKKGCYLVSRSFMDSEIRMLIDGVLGSKYITVKQSKSLIERLARQSSKYFRPHISHVYAMEDWNKTDNQALFFNIELIDKAIEEKKQIHYDYNKFGLDKKLHKSSHQFVSPYQLILHNQRYYLMGYSAYWGNMIYHRIDHISNMSITDDPAYPIRSIKGYENGIDYKKLSSQLPYMYADDPVRIRFIADEAMLDQIVDWFGKDARINRDSAEKKLNVSITASPQAMKHWALQYLEHVEVLEPKELREDLAAVLEKGLQKYQ